MSTIDNAIARLQALALASTSVDIGTAPNAPIEDATDLPMSIAHLSSGEVAMHSSINFLFPVISVDFHFDITSLTQAYTQINSIAQEYGQRLAGDPTLNSTVDTIVFPVPFTVEPMTYDSVPTLMLRFDVTIKTMENPIT